MSAPGTSLEKSQLEAATPIEIEHPVVTAIHSPAANPNSDAKHESKAAAADFFYDLLLVSSEYQFLEYSDAQGFVDALEGILSSKDKMSTLKQNSLLTTLYKSLISASTNKNSPDYKKAFEYCNRLFEFWIKYPDAIGSYGKISLLIQISRVLCNYILAKAKQQTPTDSFVGFHKLNKPSNEESKNEDKTTNPTDFLGVFYRCTLKTLDVLEQNNSVADKALNDMAFWALLNLIELYSLLEDVPNLNNRSNSPEKIWLFTIITKIVNKYFQHIGARQQLFDRLKNCIEKCTEFSERLEFHKMFISIFDSLTFDPENEQDEVGNYFAFLKYFADIIRNCAKEGREVPDLIRDKKELFFQILCELTKEEVTQNRRQDIVGVLRGTLDNGAFWLPETHVGSSTFVAIRQEAISFLNRGHVTDSAQFFAVVHFLVNARIEEYSEEDFPKIQTMIAALHEIEEAKVKANPVSDSTKETKKDTGPVSFVNSETRIQNTLESEGVRSQPEDVQRAESKQQAVAAVVNSVAAVVQSAASEAQQEQISYTFKTLEHLQGRNTNSSAPAVNATAQPQPSAQPSAVPEHNKF